MEENGLLELSGQVAGVVYRNEKNQYTVLTLLCGEDREEVTVVGVIPMAGEGEELRVFGRWEMNQSYGRQFRAEAFEHARPVTEEGMLMYLSSGAVKGVGRVLAGRIIDTFGVKALEIIEQDPERLAQIKGVSLEKAREISEEYRRISGIRELMVYLSAFGVPPEQAMLVWKRYGDESIACVQEDPYILCAPEIGVGFHAADQIAQSMERPFDDMSRIQAGIVYALRHNVNNGHTCVPRDALERVAAGRLGVGPELVRDGTEQLLSGMVLMGEDFSGREYVFLQQQHLCEQYIAGRMRAMLRAPARALYGADMYIAEIEEREGIKYAEKQKEAVKAAMEQGVLILTGGPGTGKTTALNAVIRILKQAGERVLLAAPTGRAAKRMSELTGEEAKTIHRMLQVGWDERDQPFFNRNERNPLECECLVIDEMSMVDAYVFESVLRALPVGCRLILVGDSDQLPSVGAGNVLGDLIAAGMFPTVQLKEVFRQSMESLIIANAHRIVDGEMPELRRRDNDFFFLPGGSVESAQALVTDLCRTRLPKSYGWSALEDIQVLCPSRKGELGTVELNRILREAVNPPARAKAEVKAGGQLFREGDKVMQVRNDYQLPWSREDGTEGQGVYNGDMGVITRIDKPGGAIEVRVDDRLVLYDLEKAGEELEPAYAVTVHKSQGNEFNAVVIPVMKVPRQLCYRNLFYTAVTRAKKLLILVGESAVVRQMVENDRKTQRITGLRQFLTREDRAEL